MFWGIDRDAWIQLWAGLLGAIPAAVISAAVAAGVAVIVLNRSNKHQRDLAEQAAAEQRLTTERALSEQRAQLLQQLDEQRNLAERQLAEQRNEASLVRRKAVMADLISTATGYAVAVGVGEDAVLEQRLIFEKHVYRWSFEVSDPDHREGLLAWGGLLWIVAWHIAEITDVPPRTRDAWSDFLLEAMKIFTGLGTGLMAAAGDVVPQESVDVLKTRYEELNLRWWEEMVLPWVADEGSSGRPFGAADN